MELLALGQCCWVVCLALVVKGGFQKLVLEALLEGLNSGLMEEVAAEERLGFVKGGEPDKYAGLPYRRRSLHLNLGGLHCFHTGEVLPLYPKLLGLPGCLNVGVVIRRNEVDFQPV